MNQTVSIVLIGLSLSMDAFAASVCSSVSIRGLRAVYALRASLFFGLFQFIMPVAGWFLGRTFISYIEAYDHWIAFALLAFVGGKMIKEALFREKEQRGGSDIRNAGTLLVLSLATSIDALAAGISFEIMNLNIWHTSAAIGLITFCVCMAGFEFGRRIGLLFEKGAEIAGGLVLIGLGVKILVEQLS
jgi:putative Mn2+ efflux pump MntP